MKPSRKISFLISTVITLVVNLVLYWVDFIVLDHLLYACILTLLMAYVVTYVIVEYLLYRDLYEVIRLLDELKNGARVEEVDIDRRKFRLPTIKKLYKGFYSHVLSKQYQIDEMLRIAAFRKEFIADVSHELKTPIFAAQGFVHTLLDGAAEDENVRTRFLEKAAKSLDGLDLLVHDLLTLSHIEIGETKMQFEYFDIKALAEEVIDQFEGKRANRRLELTVNDTSVTPPIVYADWVRIKQVLMNLVSNAIKYSSEDGQIQLVLESKQEAVAITVKDNGEGIPSEDLQRIFERFYRVDKSRSREKGGTGLGLAIVKHIIEGHHSKMEVESEVGRGSMFKFVLPKGKGK